MKTFKLLSMLLAAASLLLASCSIDNLGSNDISDGEECLVTLSVQGPGAINTRGDSSYVPGGAAEIKKLTYYIYKTTEEYDNWNNPKCISTGISKTVDWDDTSTPLSLDINLMKGSNYRIVFWADAFGFSNSSPYIFDMENGKLSIDYYIIESNREDYDAFCGLVDIENPSHSKTVSVPLKRPFAQLNFGTDLSKVAEYGVPEITSGIEVKCANAISLIKEENRIAEDDTAIHTFKSTARPTDYTFPVEPNKYDYICLNYILPVPYSEFNNDVAIPVKFNYTINGTPLIRSFNVPLGSNHRTNIYGDFLSSSSTMSVSIDSMFTQGDNNTEYVQGLTPLHDAAMAGGEFALDDDYDLTEPVVVYKDFILDLNNHTVSKTATSTDKNIVFQVKDGVSLTIKGFGYVSALGDENPQNNYIVWLEGYDGKLVIESGCFDGDIDGSYRINIWGGAFKNYKNVNLQNFASSYSFKDIGDWDCCMLHPEVIGLLDAQDGDIKWIEHLDDFLNSVQERDTNTHYVYSRSGITYHVYNSTMTVYPSTNPVDIYGYIIDLGGKPLGFSNEVGIDLILKQGIFKISDYAFYGLRLNTMTTPSILGVIGAYAFANCSSTDGTFTIPSNVYSIGEGAFSGALFENINVGYVLEIPANAFRGSKIKEINVPSSQHFG